MQQPKVPPRRHRERGKAASLSVPEGRGVTPEVASSEWGQKRRKQAVEGMRRLIREKIANRKQQTAYAFVPVTLPLEPVLVDSDPPRAHNVSKFKKGRQYVGWNKNMMPVASFDAGTTEWQLALLMDR